MLPEQPKVVYTVYDCFVAWLHDGSRVLKFPKHGYLIVPVNHSFTDAERTPLLHAGYFPGCRAVQ